MEIARAGLDNHLHVGAGIASTLGLVSAAQNSDFGHRILPYSQQEVAPDSDLVSPHAVDRQAVGVGVWLPLTKPPHARFTESGSAGGTTPGSSVSRLITLRPRI